MPAKRLPWLKFWPEAVDHAKFADLSDSERWTWVKLLARAGEQPVRGRFASLNHAAEVTGRPVKHLRRLLDVRLIDQVSDGVWMHDWLAWQRWRPGDEDANEDASTPEQHTNDTRSTHRTTHEALIDQHAINHPKREEIRDKSEEGDVDGDSTPSGVGHSPPKVAAKRVAPQPIPKPVTPNPVKDLIDLARSIDPSVAIFGDNAVTARKLQANPQTDLRLVAEAYVAYQHGEWEGTSYIRDDAGGALWAFIGDLGKYAAWKRRDVPRATATVAADDQEPRCAECGGVNFTGKPTCTPCQRKATESPEQRAEREALLARRPRMATAGGTA